MNNNITEDYCSFEVSKLLKERGFGIENPSTEYILMYDEDGNIVEKQEEDYVIDGYCLRPTHALAIKWIRENFNKVITIYANASGYCIEVHDSAELGGSHRYDSDYSGPNEAGCWDKFEEATEAALLYVLNNLI
jgi:hypothetical protein